MLCPDKWIILKIEHKDQEPVYKLLSGWYGGYLDGDSWRLNSGITSIKRGVGLAYITGSSGTEYKCHLDNEGVSGIMAEVILQLTRIATITICNYGDLKDADL